MTNDQDNTRSIRLTRGYVAIVDASDYDRLAAFKWCASPTRHSVYAVRVGHAEDGRLRRIYMHRQIFAAAAGVIVNHRDGNSLNNCRSNLRAATRSQNQHSGVSRIGKSKFKGVSWHRLGQKWQAHIKAEQERRYLGLFAEETDAARAYDAAALELHGEFARLNFPIEMTKAIAKVEDAA